MKEFIDKLAFIFVKDEKILMSLSRGKDTWYIPGGKREEGETDEETLVREVEEELSVKIVPATIYKYGIFEVQAHGHPLRVMVRMTCYTAEFIGELKAAAEIEKTGFLFLFQESRKFSCGSFDLRGSQSKGKHRVRIISFLFISIKIIIYRALDLASVSVKA